VASEVKQLDGQALRRSEQALAHLSAPVADRPFDAAAATAHLAALLGPAT
jgi:hypothetical protein